MKSVAGMMLVALCAIGCGGGGESATSSALTKTSTLPTQPTTYTGTLVLGNVLVGPLTTVINPDGSFTMSVPANQGQVAVSMSGDIVTRVDGTLGITFTMTPAANGQFTSYQVSTTMAYTGGGVITIGVSSISGTFNIQQTGLGWPLMTFGGTS